MGVKDIFRSFLAQVTDDIMLELDEEEIIEDLHSILLSAIPKFRYPKVDLSIKEGSFVEELSVEEASIIADLMVLEWLDRQIQNIRLTEAHYTSSDAKVLNTASQMRVLNETKKEKSKELDRMLHYYHAKDGDKNNLRFFGGKDSYGKNN